MQVFIGLVVLAIAAASVAWVVIVIRKYHAHRAIEREREASFLAETLRAKPAPRAAPAVSPDVGTKAPAQPSDALAAAAGNIRVALAAGRGADAARTFLAVIAERTKLTLEPPAWEGLGRALLAQGSYLEAAPGRCTPARRSPATWWPRKSAWSKWRRAPAMRASRNTRSSCTPRCSPSTRSRSTRISCAPI
ncbi:MAG: hypothetical protein O2979_11940 [Proteobacteria bacterium]|nr:hypothetical protein [Pseudomonadota bacterium]